MEAVFDHSIDMKDGEEAWIGYLSEHVVLEYMGCVENNKVLSFFSSPVTTNIDLGQCAVTCAKSTYFGIMLTECFCMEDIPSESDLHEDRCERTCNNPRDEAVCGGAKFVSIYRHGEGVFNDKGFLPAKNWLDMTINCYSLSLFPFTHNVANNTNGFRQIWTGLVTTRKFFTNPKDSDDTLNLVYAVNEDGKFRLKFTLEKNANDMRKYICQQDVTTSTQTVTTSTTERIQPLVHPAEGDPLLIVYILIPILVVCIVVTIIVCVCLKRKQNRKGNWDVDNTLTRKKKLHHPEIAPEFDELDDVVSLEHVEGHTDFVDYSNVSTLRISDKDTGREYTNDVINMDNMFHHDEKKKLEKKDLDGKSPEEYEYSTIEKANKKNGELLDNVYNTTNGNERNGVNHGIHGNSTYDKAEFDDAGVNGYTNFGMIADPDDESTSIGNQGLSRF
ncbi:hypothetical protein ACF0H5_011931 [Mactra antiquata]